MRTLLVVPLLGLMSFSLAAFVQQPVNTARSGMLYGHLTHDAPIERVEVAPIAGLRRPSARVLPNGDFYFVDLQPGQYVVARVRVGGAWREIASDRGIRELAVAVEPGAINYAGSWALSGRSGALRATPADSPASDVLLKRLRYSLRGTGWEHQVP